MVLRPNLYEWDDRERAYDAETELGKHLLPVAKGANSATDFAVVTVDATLVPVANAASLSLSLSRDRP